MKVIVRYMRETAADINDWVEGMAEGDPLRRAQAERYFRELATLLQKCAGPPPGAVRQLGVSPSTYWWDFYPNLWVRFAVYDGPKKWFGLFGEPARKITVLRVCDGPPTEPE